MKVLMVFVVITDIFVVIVNGSKASGKADLKGGNNDLNQEINLGTKINDDFELSQPERTGEKLTAESILSGLETLKSFLVKKRFARRSKEASRAVTEPDDKSIGSQTDEYSEILNDESGMIDESFEVDDNIEINNNYDVKSTPENIGEDQSELEKSEFESPLENNREKSSGSEDVVKQNEEKVASDETKIDWDDMDDIPITRRMMPPPDKKVLETKPLVDEKTEVKSGQATQIKITPKVGLNIPKPSECCNEGTIPTPTPAPTFQNQLRYRPMNNLNHYPSIAPIPPRFFYPNRMQPTLRYFNTFMPTVQTQPYNINPLPNFFQPTNQFYPQIPFYRIKDIVDTPSVYPFKSFLPSNVARHSLHDSDLITKLEKATEDTEKKHESTSFSGPYKYH